MKPITKDLKDTVYERKMRRKRHCAIKTICCGSKKIHSIAYKRRFGLESTTILSDSHFLVVTNDFPKKISLSTFEERTYRRAQDLDRVIDGLEIKGDKSYVDVNEIIKKAKKLGYKRPGRNFHKMYHESHYLLRCEGRYYSIAALDVAYSVINDNKKDELYHNIDVIHNNEKQYYPIVIKNQIGMCLLMPVRLREDPRNVIIEL